MFEQTLPRSMHTFAQSGQLRLTESLFWFKFHSWTSPLNQIGQVALLFLCCSFFCVESSYTYIYTTKTELRWIKLSDQFILLGFDIPILPYAWKLEQQRCCFGPLIWDAAAIILGCTSLHGNPRKLMPLHANLQKCLVSCLCLEWWIPISDGLGPNLYASPCMLNAEETLFCGLCICGGAWGQG